MNIREEARKMKLVAPVLAASSNEMRNGALRAIAEALTARKDEIFAANAQDCQAAAENGIAQAVMKRLVFNEAKLTCIALAFRLAAVEMRYKGENAASALFIDDLLISLDMGRRLQVIDIILELRKKHQLIIFTHDRAFYDRRNSYATSEDGWWL